MDESPRATKRRKVDVPTADSPVASGSNTATPRQKRPSQSSARSTPATSARTNGTTASSAPNGTRGASRNDSTDAHNSPAPQSALERLRARRAAHNGGGSVGLSPAPGRVAPSPAKVKSTTGFFKKFAKPKGDTSADDVVQSVNEEDAETQIEVQNAKKTSLANDAGSDLETEGPPESPLPPTKRANTRTPKARSTKAQVISNSKVSASRSLEDEMREIREQARKEVELEDGDTPTRKRRASGRQSQPRVPTPKRRNNGNSDVATPVAKAESAKKPKMNGVRSARKAAPPPKSPADVEIEDPMDAEPSEDTASIAESVPVRLNPPKTPTKLSKPDRQAQTHVSDEAEISTEALQLLLSISLERAYGTRPIPLTNLDDEYAKVNTVVCQTVAAGESNSMLLIGARGSGKTTMVDQILREQAAQHANDFHVVRLSGFIHTDDKIALREIWRQLGREMDLDQEENTARNYADTLTTLLALLSHPADLGQDSEAGQMTKSVIFILDEFELFASHPRQTLLYNLFDIAQSRKAPIAVLGLTTRIEVAEMLEKRVKSRFSHRFVHLSQAKSFDAFVEVCKAALVLSEERLTESERSILVANADGNTISTKKSGKQQVPTLELWDTAISHFLASPDVTTLLRRIYHTTKSVADFLTALSIPLATYSPAPASPSAIASSLAASLIANSHALAPPDSKLTLLPTLSTLQLALLICAARQTAIHATDSVSFNLAYEEFKVLASKAKIQAAASGAIGAGGRVWSKEVARMAWTGLIDAGLVMEDGYAGRGAGGGGRVDVGLEEIGESGVDLGGWARWCREI